MIEPPFALRLYRSGMAALEPLAMGILMYRKRRGKEDPVRIPERRGHAGVLRPQGRIAWLHGASVGESISILPIIERLTRRGFTVLVTTGTRSSAKVLATRLPPGAFHQFVPLDVPRYVRRFLDYWTPNLALIAESEIWPNMIMELEERSIPLIVVNGRMSERSFRRWQKMPLTARAILERIDICLTQTKADAERVARLGAPRVTVAGNLKFDAPAPPADAATLAMLSGLISGRPVWMAASTHGAEDEVVCAVHRSLAGRFPKLLTFLAPRHPERGEHVAAVAAAEGLKVVRRSSGRPPGPDTDVYVVDSIGELGLYYRLAPVVLMGGSLVPHGGQNPIEPAKLGTAILHGPHVHNFADVYAALDRADGALPVSDGETLALAVAALLRDHARVRAMARAATAIVEQHGGALERTLLAIEPYILQMDLERL
ncbi:3-deoxy-D-manno-octulosonic acid transferase [Chelatococcus reniformis]|uniref:3-deoxy-D-manno-octulosonic acid transferase n=1 Tax=Chelatococcus reniformis TaxID=1494448 RepID=A0A916UBG5_9HYPH|nr:3-deoxy-D-manno-octulosonic acid transferase [Chelatococcus reniformis]GGC67549.1 3-deoxy-D-manno-octulosonic acid transferase [Chelatococcus reniformis]